MVFAETTFLVQLREKGLIQRLFDTSHSFHIVDIVADQLDDQTKDLFLASGVIEQPLSPAEMMLVVEAHRALSCACVGQVASLIYAEASGSELLSTSIPFIKLERAKRCGAHDFSWVKAEVEPATTLSGGM